MMTETEVQTSEVHESFVARWWTVAVGVLLILAIPLLGLAWSLAMAFTQRQDRRLSGVLLIVAGIALAGMVLRASTAGVVG